MSDTLKYLIDRVDNFSELDYGWDSYGAYAITKDSINTAKKIIYELVNSDVKPEKIEAYTTRDGGVQLEIGEYIEICILNFEVTETHFDIGHNIIIEDIYNYKEKNREFIIDYLLETKNPL